MPLALRAPHGANAPFSWMRLLSVLASEDGDRCLLSAASFSVPGNWRLSSLSTQLMPPSCSLNRIRNRTYSLCMEIGILSPESNLQSNSFNFGVTRRILVEILE